ncbi:MAG: FHA domain-containing protein [Allobaculum sp.]|nr:FHA domain-containing protein [Allobaculum sp.]
MAQLENNLQWTNQSSQIIPELTVYDSLILDGGWIEPILWSPSQPIKSSILLVRSVPADLLIRIPSTGLTIGSSVDADLILDDPTISRLHVKLEVDPDEKGVWLKDLGSLNRTFFEGLAINEPILLQDNDEFILARKRRFKIEKVEDTDD